MRNGYDSISFSGFSTQSGCAQAKGVDSNRPDSPRSLALPTESGSLVIVSHKEEVKDGIRLYNVYQNEKEEEDTTHQSHKIFFQGETLQADQWCSLFGRADHLLLPSPHLVSSSGGGGKSLICLWNNNDLGDTPLPRQDAQIRKERYGYGTVRYGTNS